MPACRLLGTSPGHSIEAVKYILGPLQNLHRNSPVLRIKERPPPGKESVDGMCVGNRCEVQPGGRRGTIGFVGELEALQVPLSVFALRALNMIVHSGSGHTRFKVVSRCLCGLASFGLLSLAAKGTTYSDASPTEGQFVWFRALSKSQVKNVLTHVMTSEVAVIKCTSCPLIVKCITCFDCWELHDMRLIQDVVMQSY